MKKIANIICSEEIFNHKKIDWINYVSTTADANLSLPTLFIGWNKFKHEFPHLYPNILVKKPEIKYPLTWEFSMEERITDHFKGIEDFIKKAPREYCELYQYKSIDPIIDKIENELDLVSKIPLIDSKFYQYKDEIIYIFSKKENKIYGIYLNSFRYFKYDTQSIVNHLSTMIENHQIDIDGSLYQSYYKQFPNFDQLKRSIVLFLD